MLSVPVSVLGISDGRPEINSAYVNETNNELVVRWTSTHAGIVNFAVNALDNITGNKYSAVVGSNISETALALCNPKNEMKLHPRLQLEMKLHLRLKLNVTRMKEAKMKVVCVILYMCHFVISTY